MKFLFSMAITATIALVASMAAAAPIEFDSRTAFLDAGGTYTDHSSSLFTDFGVTALPPSSLNSDYATFSDKFAGNEYVILNGDEEFDITLSFATSIFAFGMDVQEPTSTAILNGCNFACTESTFEATIFSGATNLGSISFEPANDTLSFFGISSQIAFDKIEVREIAGTADNEFFGNFVTSSTAFATPIPLPAGLPLLLVGLGGFGLLARRRSTAA